MKMIKCDSCSGKWMIENADLEKLTLCPYCGVSIQGKVEFSEYDTLDKAIYGAVTKMGKDVLQNPRRLTGFMMDTAPGLKKEIRIFSKTVNENYVGHIKSAFEEDLEASEVTINKLRHLFVEEEGLSENWADILCAGLHGAILYTKGIGTSEIINVEISDYTYVTDTRVAQDQLEQDVGEITTEDISPADENIYDISKHYKRSRGFMIEEYNLSNEDSEEWPNCSDENRRHLEAARKYLSEKRLDDALEECRKVANCGYVPAYNLMAEAYREKRNYKKAWKWYSKAAEADNSIGLYYVGLFYQEGVHVMRNPRLALKYFEKAAARGLADAMVELSVCYELGIGCEQNLEKSLEYLQRAADDGCTQAQYRMRARKKL